jgi:transcriptional regulator with XRE-family HTH domain
MDEEGRRRFGLRLKGLRDSLAVYKNLELGRTDISMERGRAIADALDVPFDDLIAAPGTPFGHRLRKGLRESGIAGPILAAELVHKCLCCWYKYAWLVIG